MNFADAWNFTGFQNLSLLSIDFTGFGFSDKPENFSYEMAAQASVCSEIIRQFQYVDLHIIAHSMGGAIGLLFPDDLLKQIRSFANLEGNLISADCFTSRQVARQSIEEFNNSLFPKMKRKLTNKPEILRDLENASPLAYYRSCVSLVSWSDSGLLLEKFRKLSCRKAYFYGERNGDIEPLRSLKDIRCIQVEKSGHMMMLDNPKGFYETLNDFLSLLSASNAKNETKPFLI